jgi:hypothetical protein
MDDCKSQFKRQLLETMRKTAIFLYNPSPIYKQTILDMILYYFFGLLRSSLVTGDRFAMMVACALSLRRRSRSNPGLCADLDCFVPRW